MRPAVWWALFVGAVVVGLVGDVALKRAGLAAVDWRWFVVGLLAYSSTSVAWFFLLRARKLSTVGTLYPVASAIGLVMLGVMMFGERLGVREWVGLGLGVGSLVMLSA